MVIKAAGDDDEEVAVTASRTWVSADWIESMRMGLSLCSPGLSLE